MVTKYANFLNEAKEAPGHLQQLTLDEAAAYVKAHCTEWLADSDTRLYRGYRAFELYDIPLGTILLADPGAKESPGRPMYPSKALYNFVTASPAWRGLPNRAWSSFSTNVYEATARFAKQSDTYVVVPVDGASFGHCPEDFNFLQTIHPLTISGHSAISYVYNICEAALAPEILKPFTDITYTELVRKCAAASAAFKANSDAIVSKYLNASGADSLYYKDMRRTLMLMLEEKGGDIMAMLEHFLRPENLQCSAVSYQELVGKIRALPKKTHEAWTADKHLLLPGGTVKQLVQML